MSSGPPPPPARPSPPPALPSPTSHGLNSTPEPKFCDINSPVYIDPDICTWASENQPVREACSKFKICLYKEPFKYIYRHVEPILQVGPTCGLVAISMVINGTVSPEEILKIAKTEGYTCQGEMLSCKNLVNLTKTVLSLAKIKGSVSLQVGDLCCKDLVERLLNGAILLVPYDADCNHSPCQRRGHTAHWALITGVIITEDPGDIITSHLETVNVFARHGKSKHLAIWKLSDLDKSNKNLLEFSPKKETDGLPYVQPEGGMGGENGLRNQFVIIEGLH